MELKYLGFQSGTVTSQASSACFPSKCARKILRFIKLLMVLEGFLLLLLLEVVVFFSPTRSNQWVFTKPLKSKAIYSVDGEKSLSNSPAEFRRNNTEYFIATWSFQHS